MVKINNGKKKESTNTNLVSNESSSTSTKLNDENSDIEQIETQNHRLNNSSIEVNKNSKNVENKLSDKNSNYNSLCSFQPLFFSCNDIMGNQQKNGSFIFVAKEMGFSAQIIEEVMKLPCDKQQLIMNLEPRILEKFEKLPKLAAYFTRELHELSNTKISKKKLEVQQNNLMIKLRAALQTEPLSFIELFTDSGGFEILLTKLETLQNNNKRHNNKKHQDLNAEANYIMNILSCIKIILTVQEGVKYFLLNKEDKINFFHFFNNTNITCQELILDIYSILCGFERGHIYVIRCVDIFLLHQNESTRYSYLIYLLGINSPDIENEKRLIISLITFINALIFYEGTYCKKNYDFSFLMRRMQIRLEFIRLDICHIFGKLEKYKDQMIQKNIEFFYGSMADDEETLQNAISSFGLKWDGLKTLTKIASHILCDSSLLHILKHVGIIKSINQSHHHTYNIELLDNYDDDCQSMKIISILKLYLTENRSSAKHCRKQSIDDITHLEDEAKKLISNLDIKTSTQISQKKQDQIQHEQLHKEQFQYDIFSKNNNINNSQVVSPCSSAYPSPTLSLFSRISEEMIAQSMQLNNSSDVPPNLTTSISLPTSPQLIDRSSKQQPTTDILASSPQSQPGPLIDTSSPPPPPPQLVGTPPPPPLLVGTPPPPPQNLKNLSTTPLRRLPIPDTSLKNMNWCKIPDKKIQGTIWEKCDDLRLFNKIDLTSLHKYFAAKNLQKPDTSKSNKAINNVAAPKKHIKTELLEFNMAQNICIFLKTIQVSIDEFIQIIINLDENNQINYEKINQLYKFLSKDDVISSFKTISADDTTNLSNPSLFLYKLTHIPHYQKRFKFLKLVKTFDENTKTITSGINVVTSACEQLSESNNLQKILELILTIGNYMNTGIRGNAQGIRISSINKIMDVKSNISNFSLANYMVHTIKTKITEAYNIDKELSDIPEASNVDFNVVSRSLFELESSINEMKLTQQNINDEIFIKAINKFFEKAIPRINHIEQKFTSVNELVKNTMKLFGEDISSTSCTEFLQYFATFIKNFVSIKNQNESMRNFPLTE